LAPLQERRTQPAESGASHQHLLEARWPVARRIDFPTVVASVSPRRIGEGDRLYHSEEANRNAAVSFFVARCSSSDSQRGDAHRLASGFRGVRWGTKAGRGRGLLAANTSGIRRVESKNMSTAHTRNWAGGLERQHKCLELFARKRRTRLSDVTAGMRRGVWMATSRAGGMPASSGQAQATTPSLSRGKADPG
jgi:hypothetical protein